MINTVAIKGEQLSKGFFTIGSGKEVVLIMGSCRVAPYVEYLHQWNLANGNRFTIHSLDAFNFNWTIRDERCDFEAALSKWETDERMLNMLSSVDIFVHEWYQNAAMFNVNKGENKTIYHFGMSPKMDICLCNFNDYFILFKDIVSFDIDIRKIAVQDINVTGKLSQQIQKVIYELGKKNLNKFYEVCLKSDIPEMKEYFESNFIKKRLFQTYNHVSKNFTMAVFNFLDKKFLNLNLPEKFYDDKEDMFGANYTPITEYDIKWWELEWNEEIKPIL